MSSFSYSSHHSIVLYSLKSHEEGVRQKIKNSDAADPIAPELELNSLSTDDQLVQRQLPLFLNAIPTPFVQTNAIQLHYRSTRRRKWKDMNATVFYEYYKGGRLFDVISAHEQFQLPVPLGFIWHVITQLGRALAGNVWLHYPTEEEKKANPELWYFGNELPQIILGDFGFGLQAEYERKDQFCKATNPGLQEAETLRDKSFFATNIVDLMLTSMGRRARELALGTHKTAYNGGKRDLSEEQQVFKQTFQQTSYSEALKDLFYRLIKLRHRDFTADFYGSLNWTTEDEWRDESPPTTTSTAR
ncbi:hypothetical protein N0V88_002607 [Collariella sp. IMI 366227]|nr:hypothetical protein N0V88_002607 [Collariella sp. IMI 366227]